MIHYQFRAMQISVILLMSHQVIAQEIIVNLGQFPAPPCVRSSSQQSTKQENHFGQRLVTVSAKLFLEPANPQTISAAQFCGRRIKDELSESRSAINLQLFTEVFQDAISRCVIQESKGVRYVKSLIIRTDDCQ